MKLSRGMKMSDTIKIGTRGSILAVRQAEITADEIKKYFPDVNIEIVKIVTTGDKNLNVTIDKIGGKGVFVKEIENALLNGKIDIAVHSMKDMPIEMPKGLFIGAVLKRANPFDALVSNGYDIFSLPKGAKVGTGSGRRAEQILLLRSDLQVIPIRGNIITRLDKLNNGFDAVILAAAGLYRMGFENKISQIFTASQMVPAVCQGILAVQMRENDERINKFISHITDENSYICSQAERAFLKETGADCHSPIGGYTYINGTDIFMESFFYDGKNIKKGSMKGNIKNPCALGERMGSFIMNEVERG